METLHGPLDHAIAGIAPVLRLLAGLALLGLACAATWLQRLSSEREAADADEPR